ncbi:UDP-glycosyltransferase UGT5 [Drosophila grimshawi]|uniref:UDP-glucuronosyltransferase n=1 Tax=Drosophila grimshawi TaxID=7222 RepID=B4JCR1_DROGR|nr:UDP-glycosyltransferase UGT5 [Drosophila grimshawi]EDW04225.1 GH10101 [Drosophila grimshawi]
MNWALGLTLVLLLTAWAVAQIGGSHILGVFVDVHRSQLLVHLSVARVLLQRGHQLTLVTSLPLEDDWLSENITHFLVDWQPKEQQITDYNANFVGRLQRTLSLLEQSGELLLQSAWLNFMHATPTTPYDLLLLGYHFNDHLLGVAAHFACPVAIISTQQPIGFVHSLLVNPEERWYVPQPYDSRQRTGFEGWVFGVWEKSAELLARRVMQRIYSTHFATPPYPSFEEMRLRVSLALNNHHMISEGPIAPLLPSMLDIGGIVMEQSRSTDNSNLALNQTRSVIIFSLGTRFSWRSAQPQLERIFVEAFAQLEDYDICWTYDGDNATEISLANRHIRLSNWWPQAQLLAHPCTRLLITHGGKGSLSEALYYGIPLLGLPLRGDQRANLLKMQARGWGLSLDMDALTPLELLATIQRLLKEEQFKQRIQVDSQLYRDRPLSASNLTGYWLEYVIRHKGAQHLSGNARQLTIWQRQLIDVRLVVFGTMFLISWTALWLIK